MKYLQLRLQCAQSLSCVWLFATPGTVARQAPLFMGFPKQEDWSRLPFPQALRPGIQSRSCSQTHPCGWETILPRGENGTNREEGYFVHIFCRGSVQSLCSFSSLLFLHAWCVDSSILSTHVDRPQLSHFFLFSIAIEKAIRWPTHMQKFLLNHSKVLRTLKQAWFKQSLMPCSKRSQF